MRRVEAQGVMVVDVARIVFGMGMGMGGRGSRRDPEGIEDEGW